MTKESGTVGQAHPAGKPMPDVVVLRAKGRRHVQRYRAGDTLLETSRRAGVPIPSNCRLGDCGTCVVRLLRGQVIMRRNMALTDEDIAAGLVLGCQSIPVSAECEVEYG
jgi:ferredoxin